jgi:hypothetical protein
MAPLDDDEAMRIVWARKRAERAARRRRERGAGSDGFETSLSRPASLAPVAVPIVHRSNTLLALRLRQHAQAAGTDPDEP